MTWRGAKRLTDMGDNNIQDTEISTTAKSTFEVGMKHFQTLDAAKECSIKEYSSPVDILEFVGKTMVKRHFALYVRWRNGYVWYSQKIYNG